MKRFILMSALAVLAIAANGQTFDDVLRQVQENNTTLKALARQTSADQSANVAAAALPAPEIEAAYLWGSPADIGNRKDLSVSQQVDFGTLTGARRAVAERQNGMLDCEYAARRAEILVSARKACVEIVYYNALTEAYSARAVYARRLADAYGEGLEKGTVNVLEYNKAVMNAAIAEGELKAALTERGQKVAELAALNGGKEVAVTQAAFEEQSVPHDFDGWYASVAERNPALLYASAETLLGREQVRLAKAEALPSIKAGYMSELVAGQNFRGISAGLSIPIWSSGAKIKASKLAASAAEMRREDIGVRFRLQTKALYDRAVGLQASAAEYRKLLISNDNTALLETALEQGQISLLDYIVETGQYYDAVERALGAERDFRLALADLQALDIGM